MTTEFLVDGRWVGPDECRRLFDGPLPARMTAVIQRVHGVRVLDVGSYNGAFAAALARQHPEFDVLATDYDEENLRIARFLHPELESRFVEANVYDLPFEDESFDCVTFQEVIEHLEGAAQAVKELNRVLKIGGSLLISTPNVYYWRDVLHHVRAEAATHIRKRPPTLQSLVFFAESPWNRHIHAWTPATLLTLLEVNGFSYAWHGYSDDESGAARLMMRAAPFLGQILILEATKQTPAPPGLT